MPSTDTDQDAFIFDLKKKDEDVQSLQPSAFSGTSEK